MASTTGRTDSPKFAGLTVGRVARQFNPRKVVSYARAQRIVATPVDSRADALPPAQALAENGFTVFRGLIPPSECAELATVLKQESGLVEGTEYTRVDATNKFASTHRVLFDERVLGAVRAAVESPVKFLQVSDLHYLHDTAGWHRDSVHRERDSSGAADWQGGTYGVVKAILYLESDNAGMGMIAGSHASPYEIDRDLVKSIEKRHGQIVIDAGDEPNRRISDADRVRPLAWRAQVGDLLVFDERMYHAGRRIDEGRVHRDVQAAKFTLSLVFGPENLHSWRLYSYFRYARRELHYRDFPPEYRDRLVANDLLLSDLGNYYLQHPQELRLAHLRHPETLEPLIEEFTRAGAKALS